MYISDFSYMKICKMLPLGNLFMGRPSCMLISCSKMRNTATLRKSASKDHSINLFWGQWQANVGHITINNSGHTSDQKQSNCHFRYLTVVWCCLQCYDTWLGNRKGIRPIKASASKPFEILPWQLRGTARIILWPWRALACPVRR